MKTNGDEGAFAREEKWQGSFQQSKGSAGLTKREYFAALAMQGMLANPCGVDNKITFAVQYADALIAELNKNKGEV